MRGSLGVLAFLGLVACTEGDVTSRGLSVFNAAALGPPFAAALAAYSEALGLRPAEQVNAPSLEVIRFMTELNRVPDVLASADRALFDSLVVPTHAAWYVTFASNALVLAKAPRAKFGTEITTENWWQVLQRPGVAVGRSDMTVDPSGYRADMVMQLAEWYYGQPGLTERLRATIPERNVRRAEADLSAYLEAGELDYGWTYESLARAHGLSYVRLPPEIDLSDPTKATFYRRASVTIPESGGRPARVLQGAPIVFAVTVPRGALRAAAAEGFVEFLLSAEGRAVLGKSGLTPLEEPEFVGKVPVVVSSVRRGSA